MMWQEWTKDSDLGWYCQTLTMQTALGVSCKPQAVLLIISLFALLTVSLLREVRRATDSFTLILTNVEELLVMGTGVSSRQERKETWGV